MKLNLLALLGLTIAISFSSCKKDDDDKKSTNTTTTPLIVGTWKVTAQTFTSQIDGKDSTVDEYQEMEPCEKDDLMKFNSDKSYAITEGATKCDPSDPNTSETGTWVLSDNNANLTMTSDGFSNLMQVVTMTSTTLKLKMVDGTDSFDITLTRQ